jgi:hypothetical protein
MTSGDIKKMDAQKDEANTQKKTEEAYKTKSMASGGSASSRADGCATKGKTKGRFV